MLLLVGLLPMIIYAYLAWITIPVLLRHRGWFSVVAFFILFNVAYYSVVNAVWYKSIADVSIQPMGMLWAFQETLDVIIMVFLLRIAMQYKERSSETFPAQRKEHIVTFILFMMITAWITVIVGI